MPETAAYTTRPYLPHDEASVLTLLRHVLGTGRAFTRTTDFWRWKHFENPFGSSLMTVAVNSEVVGLRAFMRWQFRADAMTLSAVRAVDTATHPAHRRSGVFSMLTSQTVDRARTEGVDLIFNTPNRISLAGYLKLGWTFVGRPPLLVKVLRPVRVARALLIRREPDARAGEAAWALSLPQPDALCLREDLGTLLGHNDQSCGGRIRTIRTVEFLRWRYCHTPSLPYHACWREGPHLAAAAILRPSHRRGLREILLSELLLTDGTRHQATAMLSEVLRSTNADYVLAHAPARSVHEHVLRTAGFLPVPRIGPYLTVRPLSPAGTEATATAMARWHLSMGDLEVF